MSQDTNSVKADFNLTGQQIEEIDGLFTKLHEYLTEDNAGPMPTNTYNRTSTVLQPKQEYFVRAVAPGHTSPTGNYLKLNTNLEKDDTECESSHVSHSIGENNMLRIVPIVAQVSNTNLTIQHGIQVFWKQEKVFDSTEQEKAGEKPLHMILESIATAIVKSYDFLSIGIGTRNKYGRDYKCVNYIKTADNIFPKFGIVFENDARKYILVSDDTFDSPNIPIIASVIDQINTALKDLLNMCGYTDPVNIECNAEAHTCTPHGYDDTHSDVHFKRIDSFEQGADDNIGFYTPVFPKQMTSIINTMPKTSDDTSADITEKGDWKRDVLIMLKLYHIQYTEHKNSIHLLLPKDDIAEHAIRLICQRPNINTVKLFTFGNTTALKLSQNMTCV